MGDKEKKLLELGLKAMLCSVAEKVNEHDPFYVALTETYDPIQLFKMIINADKN